MKKTVLIPLSFMALVLSALAGSTFKNVEKVSATTNYVVATDGCQSKSVSNAKTVDLNPVSETDIRNYYSSLFSKTPAELSGTNLLKNLKPILYNMNYYSYDDVWQIYEITDRDWTLSPAEDDVYGSYNSTTKVYENYVYSSGANDKNNPYVHTLYRDQSNPDGRIREWGDHSITGTNREHVWCQSRGFKKSGSGAEGPAGTDVHHLISGDAYVNQQPHNNSPYGFVDVIDKRGNKDWTYNNFNGTAKHTFPGLDEPTTVFEPQDSDKGDIARAIFYMAARYNNYSGNDTITRYEPNLFVANYATSDGDSEISDAEHPVGMGILQDLLAWNKLDPVDNYEIHRNDLIYRNYQGNRNPFIDFPQWADYIWGTADLDGSNYNSTPTGSADPEHDTVYYTGGGETVSVTGVTLNTNNLALDVYNNTSSTLTATVAPSNATNKAVTWTSSNPNVATVNGGTVTAVGTGSSTITVSTVDGGFTATCAVTVTNSTPTVASVTLDRTDHTFDLVGTKTYQLTATVNGTNNPSQSVTWTSSNTSVATVSNSGLVTAKSVGSATITARSTLDNTKYATCSITVVDTTPTVTSVTLDETSYELDVDRENEVTLHATVNGTYNPSASVTWESSDEDVATVTSGGLVAAVAPGTATITATSVYDPTNSATCEITVIDSSIGVDTITYSKLGFTGSDSGYKTKTGIVDTTTAVYTVHSCKNSNNYVQFNTTSPAGLISTNSAGNLKNVTITFNTATSTAGRTVKVYGTKSSYSGLTDLYDSTKRGDELGSATYSVGNATASFDIDVEDGYKHVGVIVTVNSGTGAAYFDSIAITWKADGTYVAPESVTLSENSKTIGMNETFTLTSTVLPNDATNKSVTWSSSDERVAIVDANGVVTGLKAGTATITVDTVDKHLQALCTVTVTGNRKYKVSPYKDGVPYKMFLQATGYFNGGVGDKSYFGATSVNYSDGVNVYFEPDGEGYKKLYFFDNSTSEKKYVVAYQNGDYKNFGIKTESELSGLTIYKWQINSDGHIYAVADEVNYTLGLKNGQTFTTFALNQYSSVNRFMLFEYTAESFAADFLDNSIIQCTDSGTVPPVFADGYSWSDFKAIYNAMDSTQKTALTNAEKDEKGTTIEKAVARYEYLVWKYHYEDFMSRNVTLSSSSLTVDSTVSINSSTLIIIVSSIISLIGIGAIVLKKKER